MPTKKDFQAAADIIRDIKDTADRVRTADRFARFFVGQNARFDRGRFLDACAVTTRDRGQVEREDREARVLQG